jgi:hypothetical protein
VHWGQISDASFQNTQVAGEAWYQMTAGRDGIFTLEASANGGQVRVEVLNAQRQMIGETNLSGGAGRLDLNVRQGETLFVRVVGQANDVDFRLLNLVSHVGSSVSIYGTSGNDSFTFTAGGQHELSINGVAYRFASSQAT